LPFTSTTARPFFSFSSVKVSTFMKAAEARTPTAPRRSGARLARLRGAATRTPTNAGDKAAIGA